MGEDGHFDICFTVANKMSSIRADFIKRKFRSCIPVCVVQILIPKSVSNQKKNKSNFTTVLGNVM